MKIKNLAIVLFITALLLSIPCASAVNLDNTYTQNSLKDLNNDNVIKSPTVILGMKIIITNPKIIKILIEIAKKIKKLY